MKRRLLLLLVLFASAFWTMAERVDVATARKIAESVAAGNSVGLRSASEPSLIYAAAPGQSGTALRGGAMTGAADYFVFNIGTDQGFVIVSGDDRVRPVLGYSDTGKFDPDNLPENLRGMLASYQDQITWAESQNVEATPEIAAEWSRGLSGTALRNGGGGRLETALWNQGNPYNAMCPLIGGEHALTGCGATATAIIMRYHQWPTFAQNGVTVHPLAYERPEWQCKPLDYSSGYNWNSMPLEVTGSSAPEIAKLMWHIGANISMDYGLYASSSSMSDVVKALQDVFDYSLATRALQRDHYSEAEWEEMLIAELDAGRPVLYRGRTSNNEGHLFVCDGYNSNHYFSINWGWGGYKNNYFLLSALGEAQSGIYNYEQWMAVGVKKDEGESPIYELHYAKEPESSVTPLPVGSPFNLNLNFYSSASRTSSYNVNVAIYDIETGQLGAFLLPDNYYTLNNLQPNSGWFANAFVLRNIQLTSELKSSERLVVVYSLDGNSDWQILKGASDKYYAFDMNGLASMEEVEIPEVTISRNDLDSSYLWLTNWDDFNPTLRKEVHFEGLDVFGDILIRYKVNDYETWRDHIAVYYSPAWTFDQKTVTPNDEGVFEIRIPLTERENQRYTNFMGFYSDQIGVLSYDIQVYSEELGVTILEEKGNEMTFINDMSFIIDKDPIRGVVNEAIPFSLKVDGIDDFMLGESLSLTVSIHYDNTAPDVALYGPDGQEVKLTEYIDSRLIGEIAVGPLRKDPYQFKIVSRNPIEESIGSLLSIYPLVNDKNIPWGEISSPKIIIDQEPIVNYTIIQDLTNLSSDQPLEIQVEENASFSFTLTPAENYRLPDGITIMNDQTPLTQGKDYTYDKTTGHVEILKVTSNLTVQASAIDDRHFGVVFDLEGVTNNTTAQDQYEINSTPVFNLDLNAAEGYDYDGTITVKMGEQTLTLGKDYEYVAENDHFALKVPLTGTLTIIAKGTKKQYSVTLAAEGLTSDLAEGTTVTYGSELTLTLIPAEGYDLPETISISMGGTTLTSGYTYNWTTGEMTIQKVTGNIVITAENQLKSYLVSIFLTNLTSDLKDGMWVQHGSKLTFTLIPDKGYSLPEMIDMTMDAKNLTAGKDYTYVDGLVTIPVVTGRVVIAATAAPNQPIGPVEVETEIKDMTIIGSTEVDPGETYTGMITPATGYKLPYAIEVYMNNQLLTVDEEYTYDNGYNSAPVTKADATAGTIKIWNVTGPIKIIAEGVKDGYHEVVLALTNLTSSPTSFEPQAEGSKIEFTLTPYNGYELPSSIVVTMDGKTLTAGTDYTYASGKFTLEKITGLLIITAVGEEAYIPEPEEPTPEPEEPTSVTYTVTLPVVEGAVITAQGSTSIEEGKAFTFTVDVQEGYTAKDMVVKANGTVLLPDASGRYTITNVRSNVIITVTGIEKEGAVGIESVNSSGVKVWATEGYLHIQMPEAGTAYIVSMSGKLHKILTLPEGETVTAMPQGAYVVRIGNQSYKLWF